MTRSGNSYGIMFGQWGTIIGLIVVLLLVLKKVIGDISNAFGGGTGAFGTGRDQDVHDVIVGERKKTLGKAPKSYDYYVAIADNWQSIMDGWTVDEEMLMGVVRNSYEKGELPFISAAFGDRLILTKGWVNLQAWLTNEVELDMFDSDEVIAQKHKWASEIKMMFSNIS